MGTNSLLILQSPEVLERMRDLLEEVEADAGLRQLYLRDPAGIIQKKIFPGQENIPKTEINRGNRLLYALLSNDRFLEWSRSYEEELITRAREATRIEDPSRALHTYLAVVDRTTLHQDVASAATRFCDPELMAALTWRAERPPAGVQVPVNADVAVDIETFVYAVAAVAVFAVAVAAVFVPAPVLERTDVISRLDLLSIANQLSASLAERAREVRESGTLLDFSRRNIGYTR